MSKIRLWRNRGAALIGDGIGGHRVLEQENWVCSHRRMHLEEEVVDLMLVLHEERLQEIAVEAPCPLQYPRCIQRAPVSGADHECLSASSAWASSASRAVHTDQLMHTSSENFG